MGQLSGQGSAGGCTRWEGLTKKGSLTSLSILVD